MSTKNIDRKTAAKILGLSPRTIDRYIKSNRLGSRKIGNKVFLDSIEVKKLKYVRDRLKADLEIEEGRINDNVDTSRQMSTQVDKNVHHNNLPKNKQNHSNTDNSVYLDNVDIDTELTQIPNEIDKYVYNIDKNVHHNDSPINKQNHSNTDNSVYLDNVNVDSNVYNEKSVSNYMKKENDIGHIESIYKALYDEAKEELKEKQKKLEGANYKVGQLEAKVENSVPILEYRKEQQKLLIQGKKFDEEKKELGKILEKKDDELKMEKTNRVVFASILFVFLLLQPVFWLLWRYYHG